MGEVDEREVENQVERIGSQTEQIEKQLDKIEEEIQELENSISSISSNGDKEIAESLEGNLANKQQERQQVQQEAQQISQELETVRQQIITVDNWNEDAIGEIQKLQKIDGGDYSAAENRLADRRNWVEQQEGRVEELRSRLGRLSGGHG